MLTLTLMLLEDDEGWNEVVRGVLIDDEEDKNDDEGSETGRHREAKGLPDSCRSFGSSCLWWWLGQVFPSPRTLATSYRQSVFFPNSYDQLSVLGKCWSAQAIDVSPWGPNFANFPSNGSVSPRSGSPRLILSANAQTPRVAMSAVKLQIFQLAGRHFEDQRRRQSLVSFLGQDDEAKKRVSLANSWRFTPGFFRSGNRADHDILVHGSKTYHPGMMLRKKPHCIRDPRIFFPRWSSYQSYFR